MTPLPNRAVRGLLAFTLSGALALVCSAQPEEQATTQTARIVKAANAFLATLNDEQRKREVYAFDDARQRARWSNFPAGVVPRGGIQLLAMSKEQKEAAMTLVATALSKKGFEKVQAIMAADDVFKRTEGARDESLFGSDLYSVAILGTPSETKPWMLQFGGHHLAINLTVLGDEGVLTPTLTGAQPALYAKDGKTVRPLGEESDKGLSLLRSLTEDQRKRAVLPYRVADLVLGPGMDGKTVVPEGVKASSLDAAQRRLLLDVVRAWVGIVNDDAAKLRMKEIEEGLDETYFAWSGPTDGTPGKNVAAYYRIQGPKLVIEYAPQSMRGDDPTLHVHTIYRDPTNDYGRAHK